MTAITQQLESMNRPSLLVRTARIALSNFNRETVLFKIFGFELSEEPKEVLVDLIEHENELNTQRKTGDATYSIAHHISVLTAIMHEAGQFFKSATRPT